MPRESLIRRYLSEIEEDRKKGRASTPPSAFNPMNILGGNIKAYGEAVKRQGDELKKPKMADTDEDIFEKQSILRNRIDKAKKAKNQQVR